MSKFIQHPFDYQIRSAIRREASAINSVPTIDIIPTIVTQINYLIGGVPNLVAVFDILEETGTNTLDVIEHDFGGTYPSLDTEASISFGNPIYKSVVLMIEQDVIEEGAGTFPIDNVLVELSTAGTFPSLNAEASMVVV